MKTGKVRGISDKDLAAILQEHHYRLGGLTGYAIRQRAWNRWLTLAVVGLYLATFTWVFMPYDWMLQLAEWW